MSQNYKQAVNQKMGNKIMPRDNLESNLEKPRCWGYHGTKLKTPSLSYSERPPQKYLREKCCDSLLLSLKSPYGEALKSPEKVLWGVVK